MGQHLSPYSNKPVLDYTGDEGAGRGFRYGATAMQGWRKNQEDTFKCEPELSNDFHYFAVFDGHGGSEVAKYLQKKLHNDISSLLGGEMDPELALQLGFLNCDASLKDPIGVQELNEMVEEENKATIANIAKNRRTILNRSVINNDGAGCSKDVAGPSQDVAKSSPDVASSSSDVKEETTSSSPENEEDIETMSVGESEANVSNEDNTDEPMDTLNFLLNEELKSEDDDSDDEDFDVEDELSSSESGEEDTFDDMENLSPGVHSGSTGTVVLIGKNNYYCANVGDSRCVLSRGGQAIDLSIDHKPDDPEEMKRINCAGYVVQEGRINKSLNLSRAFGDFVYKDPRFPPLAQGVTAEPSIKTLAIEEKDEFIIIASDGIWNSMSSQEVVDFIALRIKEEENLRTISEELFGLVIAPDTSGDGTGCDNMTCIIIKLFPTELNQKNGSGSELVEDSKPLNCDKVEKKEECE